MKLKPSGESDLRPLVAISAGDPAGIGPEVTLKALTDRTLFRVCRPLVVCDTGIIHQAIPLSGRSLTINSVDGPSAGKYRPGTVDVLDVANVNLKKFRYGRLNRMCGKASFEYVAKVIELARTGQVDATVTAPINKEAINLAGFHYAGHTEIFADLTGTKNYAMMLVDGSFRVVHVSTHVSLREACRRVKQKRVLEVIRILDAALLKLRVARRCIAVSGLNPHAGESGLFGREEIEEIIPAVRQAQKEKIKVTGPHPPDTVYVKLAAGKYDAVVAMYHDQGHIPFKMMGFKYNRRKQDWTSINGVNVSLGLPIVRTSVDHGTAFDCAGRGVANAHSMVQAIRLAAQLAG